MKVFRCTFLSVVLVTCSTAVYHQRDLRLKVQQKSGLKEALHVLYNSSFYKKKDNRLLYWLELGRLYHLHGFYYASNDHLDKALNLTRELYTKSVSKKAQALTTNDRYDIYYGEKYEYSLIRFYISLNHLFIWQQGGHKAYPVWVDGKLQEIPGKKLSEEERRNALMSARALLLDWDSYLKELAREGSGKSVFKEDMLAKTYGGIVHEVVGGRHERQIALELYKDAKQLLFKNYNAYSSFNRLAAKFKSNFSRLPSLGLQTVEKKYVQRTEFYKRLEDFLNDKIHRLSKSLREDNVTLIVQAGQIPDKIGEKQYYGLEAAMSRSDGSGAAARFGVGVLTFFAVQELGLLPPPTYYSPPVVHSGLLTAQTTLQSVASISFELPKIVIPKKNRDYTAVVYKGDKEVHRREIPLINPLGDIAGEAVAERSAALYGRIGLRMALKYIPLIVAAYSAFQNSEDPLSRQLALLLFVAGAKGIQETEKADIRYWSTLPADIRLLSFSLSPGRYHLEIYSKEKNEPIYRQDLDIQKKGRHKFVNIQVL